MAAALLRDHAAAVPAALPALLRLPGVGRKTANLVLGWVSAFRLSAWIPTCTASATVWAG